MPIRIIAGEAKGRKLKSLPPEKTRPLLARIKKSLFDIIGAKIKGCVFLDLYAGTGSVGIEALSRGAKEVVFIEKESQAVKVIKENLRGLNLSRNFKARLIQHDIRSGLPRDTRFDFIFVAPPYKLKLITPTLRVIGEANILASNGWIICQHHFREKLPEEYFPFELFREKKYGDTILSFYRWKRIDNEKIGLTTEN